MRILEACWLFALAAGAFLLGAATPASAQPVNAAIGWLVTGDWGAGANATLRITNTGTTTLTNNLLEFDFDRTISPYNNMRVASHVGNHYGMTNETYIPKAIAPGASISFDMLVSPGNLNGAQPTNYLINGLPLAGAQPALRLGSASILEGDAGSAGLDFLVSLGPPATNTVWVRYATAGGTAASGVDFVPASGLLTFAAGATQQVVTVTIIGDTVEEGDETFTVTLSNATNASIAAAVGTGTILNNDAPPSVVTLFPLAGAVVRALAQVEVTFSEPVSGVDAADLLANGVAATNVIVAAGNRFVFQFAPLAPGLVTFAWAGGHGIVDFSAPPNPFAGGSWSVTYDPNAPIAQLAITEVLAANVNGLLDEDGSAEDWIEIQNRGATNLNLAGWSLSDDADVPGQWALPARALGPGQFLVVFASGKDRAPVVGANRPHASFKLAARGEFVGLYTPDSPRVLASAVALPAQRNDHSYGLDPTGALRYFAAPTPGASNGLSSITGACEPVEFSAGRGHYAAPFALNLACATPGAVIRFTTNGTPPTLVNGATYVAPLRLTNTTLLRAAAFRTNHLPSVVETHSFLFNHTPAIRSLPVLSIVTDQNHLTGPLGIAGISNVVLNGDGSYSAGPGGYFNPVNHGVAWERPVSVEFIRPGDHSGFQADGGVRLQGSDYQRARVTSASKISLRLYFRGDYGAGRLRYPLFPLTSVEEFDQIILRAGFNDNSNPFLRDELTRRVWHDMGQVAAHGTFVNLFVNGEYRGHYNPTERVHAEMCQQYFGGTGSWDVFGPNWAIGGGVTDGDRGAFNNLVNTVNNSDLSVAANYLSVAAQLDVVNFADYMLLNAYAAMGDWPGNNFRVVRHRAGGPAGLFRYVVWDAEWAMGIYDRTNTFNSFTQTGGGPYDSGLGSTCCAEAPQLYVKLRANSEFRLLWADRVQKHFFNGGALAASTLTNRHEELRRELLGVIPNMSTAIPTYWMSARQPIFFAQMQPYGLVASNAPVFNQHGGRVSRGFALTMTAPLGGAIYFTTNGADPRVPFSGAASNAATAYAGAVVLNQSTLVKARTLRDGTNWSALSEASFIVATLGVPLRFTEIHYNPTNGGAFEFVELLNTGPVALDLGGMSFEGFTFTFPNGAMLAAGGRVVVASDLSPSAFTNRYPTAPVAGYFSGGLNNGGERLALLDRCGNVITSVDYRDSGGWPTAPDGGGYSLEIIDPLGDPNDPANWRASAQPNGNPGGASPALPAPVVRLSEVLAENLFAVDNAGTRPDFIELENTGAAATNIAGWSLSDDGNARNFTFPAGAVIPGNSFLVVWADAATNPTPGRHAGFALDRDGETVSLYNPATQRVDAVSLGLQIADHSAGRVAADWTLTTPTPGAANTAAPLAAQTSLVLNEWLANAPPGLPDWLELHNRAAAPVALRGLFVSTSNAVQQLAALSFIAPGGFAQLFADEQAGPAHLDFKLPAIAGAIALADALAIEFQRVTYAAQTEGVTRGRLPDGAANLVNFPGTASPAASNYVVSWSGPVWNEILSRSSRGNEALNEFVELRNPGASAFNLGGLSLSLGQPQTGEWIFPAGTMLGAGSHLVVWCDSSRPASFVPGDFNTGRALDGDSGGVFLFNTAGQLVNSVEYGPQVPGLSIGLSGGQWRLLTAPTPGNANSASAVLGPVTALRLNEWMAAPLDGADWFELHNTATAPVALAGLVLTDDPSLAGTNGTRIAPLSFIGARGFTKFVADGQPEQGRHRVAFNLNADGDSLRLYDANAATILDDVSFGPQSPGVSQGRLPDGAAAFASFPGTATPAAPNYVAAAVSVSEISPRAAAPALNAIELHNPGPAPANIGGWFLSDSTDNFKKFRITDGTSIGGGGFAVIPQAQFGAAFALDPALGGEVWLSAADAAGNLTGARAVLGYGPAAPGISFGRITTPWRADDLPLELDSPGFANDGPLVGPVVLNELMYHPVEGAGGSEDEFIEVLNLTGATQPLHDSARPANRWQLAGGVSFTFPPGVSLAANASALVVNFDPANTAALAAFRAKYAVAAAVQVFGPFTGKLANDADTVRLLQPVEPVGAIVPLMLVDLVRYSDAAPWPAGASDGGGHSLQRRNAFAYGNDPANWAAASPTAGAANSVIAPPVITVQPAGQSAAVNGAVTFIVAATGPGPLTYQWRRNGVEIPAATNSVFTVACVVLSDDARYDAFVCNAGGSVFSLSARLIVTAPPQVLASPVGGTFTRGSDALLTVAATGGQPLGYQWFFDGAPIPGATQPGLFLPSIQPASAGIYSVSAQNTDGTATSAAAVVVVQIPLVTTQPLLSPTNVWRYHQAGTDLGTAWRAPAFNDSAWSSGPAFFGYETTSPYPYPYPIRTALTAPANGGPVTAYLRARFNFTNAGGNVTLISSNWVDDGAVYYLNGVEVGRLRLPSGVITFSTVAENVQPEGQLNVLYFPGDALTNGTNILAVELHQAGTTSSDVVFGLGLAAQTTFSVPWMLTPIPQPNGAVLLVLNGEPGRRYAIECSTNLTVWTPLLTVSNTAPHAAATDASMGLSPRFYRARLVP